MNTEKEKKEILEYKNEINDYAFKKFGEADFNLFFAIVLLAKKGLSRNNIKKDEKNNFLVTIPYATIKKMSGFGKNHIANDKFEEKYLVEMIKHLQDIHPVIEKGKGKRRFDTLFPTFDTDLDKAELTAHISEEFYILLHELDNTFTKLELKRFVQLDSKYTKTLYRKLSQFRRSGEYKVKPEDFRILFDVPNSYTTSDIMKRIINPSIKELKGDFKNLKFDTHNAPKRGKPIDLYIFTFVKELSKKEKRNLTEGQTELINDDNNLSYAGMKKGKKAQKNSFNNFPQNTYDYDKLEEQLLDN